MGEVKLMQVLADAYYDKPDEVNNKVCPYIHVWVGVWDDEPQSTSKYELLKDAVITARKLILQEGVTNHDGEIINVQINGTDYVEPQARIKYLQNAKQALILLIARQRVSNNN